MVIISLLAFLGIATGFYRWTRLPAHLSYLMATSFIILAGFFMGIMGAFHITMLLLGGFGIALLGETLWQTIRNKEKPQQPLWQQPFLLFCGLLVLSLPWLTNFVFIFNDEFSHWGLVLRNMTAQQSLITADSIVNFYSYPPGASIFQYFISLFEGYHEGYFYTAHLILMLAALSAFISPAQEKKHILAPVITMGIMIGLTTLHYNIFSLYVDVVLALFFGATIVTYLILKDHGYKRIYTALPLMVLPLLKPAGMLLVLFALLLMIGFEVRRLFTQKNKAIFTLLIMAFLVCSPLISQSAFKYYHTTLSQSEAPHTPEAQYQKLYKSYSEGTLSDVQNEVLQSFKTAFFEKRIITSGNSPFEMMLFILGIALLAFILQKERSFKKEIAIVTIYMAIFSFIYLALLLVLYLTSMGDYEATRLASYKRYTNIFYLPWLLMTLHYGLRAFYTQTAEGGYFFPLFQKPYILKMFYLSALSGTVLVCLTGTYKNIEQRGNSGYIPRIPHIKSLAQETREHLPPDAKKVFIMWQHSNGYDIRAFKHYMTPEYIADGQSLGTPYGPKDIWTRRDEHADLMKWLDGYDYLVIAHSDRSFWEKYADYFTPDITEKIFEPCNTNGQAGEASKQLLFEIKVDEQKPRLILKTVLKPDVAKSLPRTSTYCETR